MKITINFNQKEKEFMMSTFLKATEEKEVIDKNETVEGDFGNMNYDRHKNEITVDLKTGFIMATSGLVLTVINMIKTLLSTYEMFDNTWFMNNKSTVEGEEPETNKEINSFEKENKAE